MSDWKNSTGLSSPVRFLNLALSTLLSSQTSTSRLSTFDSTFSTNLVASIDGATASRSAVIDWFGDIVDGNLTSVYESVLNGAATTACADEEVAVSAIVSSTVAQASSDATIETCVSGSEDGFAVTVFFVDTT